MKVKKRNLIELILQCVALILLFFNKCFVYQVTKHNMFGSSKVLEKHYSYIQRTIDNHSIIGFLTIALFIIGIVLFVIQLVSKGDKRNSKSAAIIPIAKIIMLIVSAIMLSSHHSQSTNYDPAMQYNSRYDYYTLLSFMFYICCAILLVLALISIISYLKAKNNGIEEEFVNVKVIASEISNADELKKYKNLLDAGIITQAEFDAKKKQLLGL